MQGDLIYGLPKYDAIMAETGFLASTLLTGVLLLAILGVIGRLRDWQRNAAASGGGGAGERAPSPTTGDRLERALRSPTGWILTFLALVLGFGGGAVLFVSDPSVPGMSQGALQLLLAGAFALVILAYVFLGVYVSARARGQKSAFAAMIGAWVLGLLFIAAISLQLLLGG